MDINLVRWENCYADVVTSGHGRAIAAYLDDVVQPALTALSKQVERWEQSEEQWAPFALSDSTDLLKTTVQTFALAIQSVWERQIRGYLLQCARDLKKGDALAKKVARGTWDDLRKVFLDLRGVPIEGFPSFERLDLLQLLGSACRHGDGPSAIEVFKRCPELWPDYSYKPTALDPPGTLDRTPSVEQIEIPPSLLRSFTTAIVWFWDDTEIIYINSLKSRHPSANVDLVKLLQARESRQ